MAMFVLPLEAERLNSSHGSLWVGIYMGVCGLTQVICPIAGKLSDRHASKYGRRRPFIVGGTVATVFAFAAMRVSSLMCWPWVFLASLFIGELSLNVVYSAQCGLPADLQQISSRSGEADDGSRGIVSGYIALHSFLGSICAMGMIYLTRTDSVQVEYPLYMASLIFACFVICMSVQEAPTDHLPGITRAPLSLKEMQSSFLINLDDDLDFFWVCAGRVFYYISTSNVVFLYYYIRDMVEVGEGDAAVRSHLVFLVIVAQLVGAGCSIPCSHLSNKVGRKAVIYAANALMALTWVLYSVAPKCGLLTWPVVLLAGLCFGVGSGAYLSVDYALALDCMPVGKTTAEAFGLWGVAGFLGSTVGPLVGGILLSWSLPGLVAGHNLLKPHKTFAEEEYPYMGYVMVLLATGSIMNAAVSCCTAQIRGLPEDI